MRLVKNTMLEKPRLATMEDDYWELRSGEKSREENPNTFWIPEKEKRNNLTKGKAVKLIFDIETQDEDGNIQCGGERMWVIVLSKEEDFYLGILDNEPASIEPGTGYLEPRCKIWFKAEHVIDITDPPKEYLEEEYPNEFTT